MKRAPTGKEVTALEGAARKAWRESFPNMNFPYDLDVRFGALMHRVHAVNTRDPRREGRADTGFVRNEFHRLAKMTMALRRDTRTFVATPRSRFGI